MAHLIRGVRGLDGQDNPRFHLLKDKDNFWLELRQSLNRNPLSPLMAVDWRPAKKKYYDNGGGPPLNDSVGDDDDDVEAAQVKAAGEKQLLTTAVCAWSVGG